MYTNYNSLLSDTQSYQLDSGLDVTSRIDGDYEDEIYWWVFSVPLRPW